MIHHSLRLLLASCLAALASGCVTATVDEMTFNEPTEGIGDASVVTAEGADRDALIRRFGVMYQSGALFGSMTLLKNQRGPFLLKHGPLVELKQPLLLRNDESA